MYNIAPVFVKVLFHVTKRMFVKHHIITLELFPL